MVFTTFIFHAESQYKMLMLSLQAAAATSSILVQHKWLKNDQQDIMTMHPGLPTTFFKFINYIFSEE